MFQRLSNLLFGEVEEVAAELKGPNPCVTEADEEGWMIVNLSGKSQLREGKAEHIMCSSRQGCVMIKELG